LELLDHDRYRILAEWSAARLSLAADVAVSLGGADEFTGTTLRLEATALLRVQFRRLGQDRAAGDVTRLRQSD